MEKSKEKMKKKAFTEKLTKDNKLHAKKLAVDITKRSRFKTALFYQSVVFNIFNVLAVFGILYLVTALPKKATELKEARTNLLLEQAKTNALVLQADLDKNQEKISDLEATRVSENTLFNFFEYRDEITADPRVSRFEISDKPVADKSKRSGYSVLIEFRGSGSEISEIYNKIQSVPYLIYPLVLDIERAEEGGGYVVSYSGILYQ